MHLLILLLIGYTLPATAQSPFRLSWHKNMLTIHGDKLPGGTMSVWYIESYCRNNAHLTDWNAHTVIKHTTELVSARRDSSELVLRCTLADGVTVDHRITVDDDGINFRLTARNRTRKPSEVSWAQPCVRVGAFTGLGDPKQQQTDAYLRKSFIFQDGWLATLPTARWATAARYTPGQVWAAPGIDSLDVNPRPFNPSPTDNGLIGCFSADDKFLFATAWQPYHELFQGVITCLHSDFSIGGLQPKETKRIRGKIYIVPNDVPALLQRYARDFPEHRR